MSAKTVAMFTLAAAAVVAAGCRTKTIDKDEFRYALDRYYSSGQNCIWPAPVKFPTRADDKDQNQTEQYNALVDAGLLERMPIEQKRAGAGSQVLDQYDLSAAGKTHWTADPAEPGFGNFCFGHPEVTSIDSFNPPDSGAAQYTVNYHFTANLPGWANTGAIRSAFPHLGTEGNGTASATLVKSGAMWQVQNVTPASTMVGGQ